MKTLQHPPRAPRRHALHLLAAAACGGLWARPAAASAPLEATVSAKKVAGNKVRTTVHAKVSLPGLVWSGPLGTWDVPEGGKREVTVQPAGVPARFKCTLTHLMGTTQNMMQAMLQMQQMMVQAGMGPPLHATASAKVS